jgi:hypothetical protein
MSIPGCISTGLGRVRLVGCTSMDIVMLEVLLAHCSCRMQVLYVGEAKTLGSTIGALYQNKKARLGCTCFSTVSISRR